MSQDRQRGERHRRWLWAGPVAAALAAGALLFGLQPSGPTPVEPRPAPARPGPIVTEMSQAVVEVPRADGSLLVLDRNAPLYAAARSLLDEPQRPYDIALAPASAPTDGLAGGGQGDGMPDGLLADLADLMGALPDARLIILEPADSVAAGQAIEDTLVEFGVPRERLHHELDADESAERRVRLRLTSG
jgi:hypothetical protein